MVLKFSPTLLVGGDKHHLIRWSVVPLGVLVENRRLSRAHSSSSAAARTHRTAPPARLVTTRESRRAELYFCSPGKTVWTNASQLVGSGRSRIVGYCNRPKTCVTWTWPTVYVLGFSEPHYILPCTACAVTHQTNLGFANLVPCAATVVYSIPCAGVHQRTGQQVSGTTCPCDPVRERANKVFGKRPARLLSSFSLRLDFLDDLRVRGRLVSNVVFFELLPSPLKLLPSLLQRLLHLQSFGTFVTFRWLCL